MGEGGGDDEPYNGPPMTLGNTASARVRLIIWCFDRRHGAGLIPAEMAECYGAETTVPERQAWVAAGQIAGRGESAVQFPCIPRNLACYPLIDDQ